MDERHRHRYEVNTTLVDQFEAAGLRFVGKDESGQRMEVVELSVMARLPLHMQCSSLAAAWMGLILHIKPAILCALLQMAH